ncbi:MAG: 8-amino-7-oxononanoate synthase [Chlamydiales bacterium]
MRAVNSTLDLALANEMAAWESSGLRRQLRARTADADFVSNDYLGFADHPGIVGAARAALEIHGAGGRAARLLGGGCALDAVAEQRAAEWLGSEAGLLFPTGYQANLGLITSLATRQDVLLSDALNHASLIDAARLSRARVQVFEHNDLEHLETLLQGSSSARRRFVLTEGVFGMDGDRAPLAAMDELCRRHDAWLIVDEAHSIGVIGPAGRGACAQADLSPTESRVAARMITGGKALGASGGLVLGSRTIIEHLLNHARTFVFTTAVSPAVSGAVACSIELVAGADREREQLRALTLSLANGLGLPEPESAILPFVVGPSEAALNLARSAQEAQLDVRAVRPPTVPAGTSRLRLVCHATNDEVQVARLVDVLSGSEPLDMTNSRRARANRIEAPIQDPIVVTGTDTDVGKTVVSALLVRALARRVRARYWKPVQTGDDSDTREVARLCADINVEFEQPAFEFPLPASPHEAAHAAGGRVDPALIERLYSELPGPAIVELAGGVLVPWTDEVMQADWLESRRPPIVLVARSGLGTLNHTFLTLEALRSRGLTPRALFLVGPAHESNRSTLAGHVQHLYEVPHFAELSPTTLDAWLDGHDLSAVLGLEARTIEA